MSSDWSPQAALSAARDEATAQIVALRNDFAALVDASASSNADDEHDPEGATIAFERAQIAALLEQAQSHLTDIEAAQQKVTDGSYGRCERCGRPVAVDRLVARPAARTCIECASLSG